MKSAILALMLLVSTNAHAGTWYLVNSQYIGGTGWMCTYENQGYQVTYIYKTVCPSFINL